MKDNLIRKPQAVQPFDKNFILEGENIIWHEKRFSDLKTLYKNKEVAGTNDNLAYRAADNICMEQRKGGIYWGITYMEPGDIDGECNMTRGYFYVDECHEFYMGLHGEGYIIFWDGKEDYFLEEVFPGSVHWLDTKYARRIINTSDEILAVGMCWVTLNKLIINVLKKRGFL